MDLAQKALISKSTPQAYKENRPGSLQNQNQQNQAGLMLTDWFYWPDQSSGTGPVQLIFLKICFLYYS